MRPPPHPWGLRALEHHRGQRTRRAWRRVGGRLPLGLETYSTSSETVSPRNGPCVDSITRVSSGGSRPSNPRCCCVPDRPDVTKEDSRRYRANVFEFLQSPRKFSRRSGLGQQVRKCSVAVLQLPANLKKLRRRGKVISNVVGPVKHSHQLVPTRPQDGLRAGESLRHQLMIGSRRDLGLNRLSEEQAGQKPFEDLG